MLAQAAYSRTTARDTSNNNDMVYQVANKERMLVTVSGDNTNGYTATITAGVTIAAPVATTPSITSGGVVNAASGAPGIAPGAWISIYGNALATAAESVASTDLVNNTIPVTLGGASATINGKAAYIGYVSTAQMNVLAPADTATGSVAVTVKNSAGTSNIITATLQAFLPGLSTLNNYVRGVRYPDGAIINGTGAVEPGYASSAAIGPGDILALYGTGFGPTNSPLNTGAVFTGAYETSNPVTATIGGISATVLFAGLVEAGLYQINVRIPASLSDGDQPVLASVGGLSSQVNALVKVAASTKLAPGSF